MSRFEVGAASHGTDLPTLQAAFRACDEETLVSEVICSCTLPAIAGQGDVARGGSLASPQRLRAALRAMRALAVLRGARSGAVPGAVAPLERFEAAPHTGLIERSIKCVAFAGPLARPCALDFLAWEDALSFRVILAGEWCAKERYLMLADALWCLAALGSLRGEPPCSCALRGDPPRSGFSPGGPLQGDVPARPAAATGYEEAYVQRLAQRVGQLNAAAYRACCDRVRDVLSPYKAGGDPGPPPAQRVVCGMSGDRCA